MMPYIPPICIPKSVNSLAFWKLTDLHISNMNDDIFLISLIWTSIFLFAVFIIASQRKTSIRILRSLFYLFCFHPSTLAFLIYLVFVRPEEWNINHKWMQRHVLLVNSIFSTSYTYNLTIRGRRGVFRAADWILLIWKSTKSSLFGRNFRNQLQFLQKS